MAGHLVRLAQEDGDTMLVATRRDRRRSRAPSALQSRTPLRVSSVQTEDYAQVEKIKGIDRLAKASYRKERPLTPPTKRLPT